jgi:hypothetical protein
MKEKRGRRSRHFRHSFFLETRPGTANTENSDGGLAFQHPAFRVLVAGYGSSRSHAVGGTLSGIFGKRSLVQIYILCLGTS